MNIPIKTSKEIQIMAEGGTKLSHILSELVAFAKAGTNLLEIEEKANQLIMIEGGEAAFKRVPSYYWATCLNVNDSIVHGVPYNYILKENDILSIDIGLFYKGFNTDTCNTFKVKSSKLKVKNDEIDKFLATGRKALKEAKKQAKPGKHVGHISQKIQEIIEGNGYNCARILTGHGVGKMLHESPLIPCFLSENIDRTPELKEGMVIAIEVIYMQGHYDLRHDNKDGWTIRTKDGKISAVFEETVAISYGGPQVLTPLTT